MKTQDLDYYYKNIISALMKSPEIKAFVEGYIAKHEGLDESINPYEGELNYHFFKGYNYD